MLTMYLDRVDPHTTGKATGTGRKSVRERPNLFADVRAQPASRPFDYPLMFADVRIACCVRDSGRISNSTNNRGRSKWLPEWLPDDHVPRAVGTGAGSARTSQMISFISGCVSYGRRCQKARGARLIKTHRDAASR